MKLITLSGKLLGVYQDGEGFFARFKPDNDYEMDIPITREQFHKMGLGGKATLKLEVE